MLACRFNTVTGGESEFKVSNKFKKRGSQAGSEYPLLISTATLAHRDAV